MPDDLPDELQEYLDSISDRSIASLDDLLITVASGISGNEVAASLKGLSGSASALPTAAHSGSEKEDGMGEEDDDLDMDDAFGLKNMSNVSGDSVDPSQISEPPL